MPALITDEGRTAILKVLLARALTDRDANLQLGLFTNVTVENATTLAAITEPVGVGYARKALTDGSWVITTTASYAAQVFAAGLGGWAGDIQGYFLATIAAGGTPRLLVAEFNVGQQLAAGALVRTGATVTAATPLAHGLATGERVNVRGANETAYNGIYPITILDSTHFAYTVAGTPTTPATGTIRVNRCFAMNEGDTRSVTPNFSVLGA